MKTDPNTIEAEALEALKKTNPINTEGNKIILNHVFKHRVLDIIERLLAIIENKIKCTR